MVHYHSLTLPSPHVEKRRRPSLGRGPGIRFRPLDANQSTCLHGSSRATTRTAHRQKTSGSLGAIASTLATVSPCETAAYQRQCWTAAPWNPARAEEGRHNVGGCEESRMAWEASLCDIRPSVGGETREQPCCERTWYLCVVVNAAVLERNMTCT